MGLITGLSRGTHQSFTNVVEYTQYKDFILDIEEFYKENFDKFSKSMGRHFSCPTYGEDVVQEAFYRALKYKGSFNPEVNEFGTWFSRIMLNCLRDFKNQDKLQGMSHDNVEEEYIDLSIESRELRELISKQRPKFREVLELYFIKGYRGCEICQIVDRPITNITSLIHYFRKGIKESDKYGG